jgi:hypothetical protein
MRSTKWVFTINNPTPDDEAAVHALAEKETTEYLIAEHEIGDQGTPHIQGYVRFTNRTYRNHLSDSLGGRAYLAVARGSDQQNKNYCSKTGQIIVEKGVVQTEKYQSGNWAVILNDAREKEHDGFAVAHPKEWILHRSAIERIHIEFKQGTIDTWDGRLPLKNWWVWGPTGIGKSRWAASQDLPKNQYRKNFNKWWCGFNHTTTCVVLEDYPAAPQGDVLSQYIKIWGDRYPFTAEVKGGSILMEPGRWALIITSNHSIEQAITNQSDRDAIKRRFTEVELNHQNCQIFCQTRIDLTILKK